ncbi:MAG: hypothetical protein IPP35_02635 [Elusimicrobia bacterium]|nr:hypothetical protein [Elusimicrobiota bacterium]
MSLRVRLSVLSCLLVGCTLAAASASPSSGQVFTEGGIETRSWAAGKGERWASLTRAVDEKKRFKATIVFSEDALAAENLFSLME